MSQEAAVSGTLSKIDSSKSSSLLALIEETNQKGFDDKVQGVRFQISTAVFCVRFQITCDYFNTFNRKKEKKTSTLKHIIYVYI